MVEKDYENKMDSEDNEWRTSYKTATWPDTLIPGSAAKKIALLGHMCVINDSRKVGCWHYTKKLENVTMYCHLRPPDAMPLLA